MIMLNDRTEFLQECGKILPVNHTGVEIGVLKGDFSKMIIENLNPKTLWLIDAFDNGGQKYSDGLSTAYSTIGDYYNLIERFKSYIEAWQVFPQRNYSFDVVKYLADDVFDFIYHDASHLYEDIKRDLIDWLPKLKVKGLMCGHDYIEYKDFGVMQAVDEFCKEYNFEMIIFNKNGGDYALRAL